MEEPSGLARTMICSNSETSARRPWVVMVYTSSCGPPVGAWPILPAANCVFCSLIARIKSPGVSCNCVMRSGRAQMRMAYSLAPKICTLVVPGTRLRLSSTFSVT